MKKLFISQPMNDKHDEDILWERQEALLQVVAEYGEEVELIDSFFQNAPHEARPLWFLGKSLELLAGADIVYFVPGWEKTRGCRIQHECAEQYGLRIVHD